MAKKATTGVTTKINTLPCSFSVFFVRVSKLVRVRVTIPFIYKGKPVCEIVHTYFDPFSGSPMFGCWKDESVFSMSASEVYQDPDSCNYLLSLCEALEKELVSPSNSSNDEKKNS